MTKTTNHYVRALAVLVAAMLALLIAASGVALAVNKVCPSGTTQSNPCSGTTGNDLLIGTSGFDFIKGLAGNDKISAGEGDDTTEGGGGDDTYSYRNEWGQDTLIDSGGSADHLNFSAVGDGTHDVRVDLFPENGSVGVTGPNLVERVTFSGSTTVIEKVTGSSGRDIIFTSRAVNTLSPGPGTGGAVLADYGGFSNGSITVPVSSDTYTRFAKSGYGEVFIIDHGGTSDKLILPFASTDAYFEAFNFDSDPEADDLMIMTSETDDVFIQGQLAPHDSTNSSQKGHIEAIQFTNETISIGSESPQGQTLSGTTADAGSTEAQVAALNEDSNLDVAEKEKLSKAAKKLIEEEKNGALLTPSDGGER